GAQEVDSLFCWLPNKNLNGKRPEPRVRTGKKVFERGDHQLRVNLDEPCDGAGGDERLIVSSQVLQDPNSFLAPVTVKQRGCGQAGAPAERRSVDRQEFRVLLQPLGTQ